MSLSKQRWTEVTPSQYRWEREALQYLRDHLPDQEPWQVWTNFEFLAGSGAIYEVDALVLSPAGLWVIEIKSHVGKLRSDEGLWVFDHEGRRKTIENPVFLANRKAKALKGVLQAATGASAQSIPWVAPLIFLAGSGLEFGLTGAEVAHVALPDEKNAVEKGRVSGVLAALTSGQILGVDPLTVHPVSRRDATIVARAIGTLTRSVTARTRVGDYALSELLDEGIGWQDWLGKHETLKNTHRRIRQYLVRDQATPDERARTQRAAEREANILQGIRDPSILTFRELINADRGPALTFDHHPQAIRLDHWLAQKEQRLDACAAFELVEKLTHAVRQAHAHHLVHRALSPQSILVLPYPDQPERTPEIALTNWQTASATGEHKTTGTLHVEELLDSRAAAYCAPEALKTPDQADGRADVFSLGCLTWRLFTGKPPGANHLDIDRQLALHGALRLAGAVDGCPEELDRLIENATKADLRHRSQIDNFADDLETVLASILGDKPQQLAADALAAHKGDQLRDDKTRELFTVDARLGSGASAIAYRVINSAGKVSVLKVARAPEHDAILTSEFEALTALRDSHIVTVHRLCVIGGHVAIQMEDAGESLAVRLRSNGFLHYDMLQRLGEDLLRAIDYLESVGVFHRDIKPDNMGVGEARGSRKQTLVLFDFSLTSTSPAKIAVGTRQYLDPFLPERKIARYDTSAERYSAAVTLYEMATARLPSWGDGQIDPRYDREAQLILHVDRFPANIRGQLDDFFRKALNRNPQARFDNAREMQRAWTTIFDEAEKSSTSSQGAVLSDEEITLDSPIVAIGLTPASTNVLDRLDVTTVRKLLELRLGDLRGTKGITHHTKIEIRDAKRTWAERFPGIEEHDLPGLPAGGLTQLSGVVGGPLGDYSIDHCIEKLLEQDNDDGRTQGYKLALLGLGDVAAEPGMCWPTQGAVGAHFTVTRQAVSQRWAVVCGRWKTASGTVTGLRLTIAEILGRQGGVMTAIEMADALLAQRGCRESETAIRRRKALAVLKAALDVEADALEQRFIMVRGDHTVFIATSAPLAQYADQLGEIADQLVASLPPASPSKAIEQLRTVSAPGDILLDDRRMQTLAAAASRRACLSPNRMEFYPRGMPATDALKLASGALAGLERIPVREIQMRVLDRYPEAELLPERPLLDRYLDDADLGLVWDGSAVPDPAFPEVTGAFIRPTGRGFSSVSGFSLLSTSRGHTARAPREPDADEITACAARLASNRTSRGFLALQVDTAWAILAEQALLRTYSELTRFDLEAELIASMRRVSDGVKISWDTIAIADAAKPGGTDANNLRRLVREALRPLRDRLLATTTPLLLTNPGLLACYDHISLLTDLRDAAGTAGGPPGIWLLIPTNSFGTHPTIDGVAVPIIGSHQTLILPKTWIAQGRSLTPHMGSPTV